MTEAEFQSHFTSNSVHIIACQRQGEKWLVCEDWRDAGHEYYVSPYMVREGKYLIDTHLPGVWHDSLEEAMADYMSRLAKETSSAQR